MNDDNENDFEIEDFSEIVEMSDLLIGFGWHDEEGHWDLATVSFPDTWSEQDVERLQELAADFADRLNQAGFTLPAAAE